MYLIVGLGNPGPEYAKTRHNVGFRCVEALAAKHGLVFSGKVEFKAITASGTMLGKRVLLAKPQTYMNLSGEAVQPLAHFYKVEIPHILIIGDDIDIPLGTLRLRKSGSSGGQNGVKHILERLGTQEVQRLRFGVSRPPGKMSPADYVLSPFKGDDEILAAETLDRAVKAVETWLTEGIEIAMTRYNGTGDSKPNDNKPGEKKAERAAAPLPTNDENSP
jgi:peptidyl-tRNA hydrolase, PTH1 family